MNLSFGHSPWILALCVLLAGAAAWWTYRETIPALTIGKKVLLGGLRFLSLAIVLMLLFEPLLQREESTTTDPVVAILIDSSESMAMADSLVGDSALSINEIAAILYRETRGMDARFYTFGNRTESVDSLEAIELSQSRTDIAGALSAIADQLSDEHLSAVILASDGLYNSGTNPVYVAESFPVPILTIAHGDSTTQKDVRIVSLISNEIAYSGTIVPVQVRIRNDGFSAGQVDVRLSTGSVVVDQQSLNLPADGGEITVDLEFEAQDPGRVEFRVSISRFPEETTYRNNSQGLAIQILDQKKSILLVAGAPSPDVSSFLRMLRSDDTAEVQSFIQSKNGSFYEGNLPTDLSEFDLILLVGYPGSSSNSVESKRLTDVVLAGTPFLFVLDRTTNLSALARDFSSVLPVRPEAIRTGFVEGTFLQSPSAASHAIFNIEDRRDGSIWRRLPPISLNESRWTTSPAATVLATTEIRGIPLGDPLFVVSRQGTVKSAALLAFGFWRWSLTPQDLGPEAERFKALFANLIQWLYATDDDRLVRVHPSEREYAEGESVILRGEVYDESLRPVSDASLSLQLTSPEGQIFPYEMQSRGNGRYSVDIGSLPAGTFSYTAIALRDDTELGSDTGSFSIGRRTLEFRRTRADFDILAQIASRSGGTALSPDQTDQVGALLRALPTFVPVTQASINQSRLWQRYPFMILILVLLSTEWFFRKRSGMV